MDRKVEGKVTRTHGIEKSIQNSIINVSIIHLLSGAMNEGMHDTEYVNRFTVWLWDICFSWYGGWNGAGSQPRTSRYRARWRESRMHPDVISLEVDVTMGAWKLPPPFSPLHSVEDTTDSYRKTRGGEWKKEESLGWEDCCALRAKDVWSRKDSSRSEKLAKMFAIGANEEKKMHEDRKRVAKASILHYMVVGRMKVNNKMSPNKESLLWNDGGWQTDPASQGHFHDLPGVWRTG